MKFKTTLKLLPIFILITMFISSCIKENDSDMEMEIIEETPDPCSEYNPEQQLIDEIIEIEAFINDNQLSNYLMTDSGVFYKITEEGEAGNDYPNINSTVRCDYVGNHFDEDKTIFDTGVNAEFKLANVIQGWQDGIPKLKRGGTGNFIIPSTLAYGIEGAGNVIGKNEIIQFEVTLHHFWE